MKKNQLTGNWFLTGQYLYETPGKNFSNKAGNDFMGILNWINPFITPKLRLTN